ncbi:class I SAM-dependent methyltransferase [Planococcus sp. N028]|uniref:Class I SAM-dependent methyltransferase n=1 Tax=Planococcus shixiaomingii TaxID=3058393 RepID=A0ABT8MZI3_9BACL|nr:MULTISPECIES: class I SAM-dependent methyltransferase [unclassified Planococcus (in: firmicutes)]MDN7241038.1 class I SAM-dependent methyltransferase [Planococcus sp. N028]WKA53292.1 class I SAM-dependent methyltransferase [Planococcus sp. N022]
MKTVVTTAYRPTEATEKKAQQISIDLSISFAERNKRSVEKMHEAWAADVLVAAKERLEFYPLGKTEPFFFHPNSSAFRTKRPLEKDPLIEVSGLQAGDVFVDCTLGMASDAIVASQHVGPDGRVIGCESHRAIAYVIGQGLATYDKMPHLTAAMKRIQVVNEEAVDYLASLPDNSVDVVYMDPMFTEEILEASNFTPLRAAAHTGQPSAQWIEQAVRTARKSVVLKAHYKSSDFEEFGFKRRLRPNTKFHYGVIDCRKEKE